MDLTNVVWNGDALKKDVCVCKWKRFLPWNHYIQWMSTDWDGQKKIGKHRQHKLGKYDGERVIKIDGKFYPVEGYDHSIKRITYVMPVVSFMGEMVVLK